MPESLLGLLKLCLLALVYIFFARVLWAVWSEVRAAPRGAPAAGTGDTTKETTGRPDGRRSRARAGVAAKLVGVQPPAIKGRVFLLGGEINIGRSPGCAIRISEDTFLSSIHARTYVHDGTPYIQDLQSKNGTFVNGARISAATRLNRGDRVQVGSTLLEVD